MESDQEMTSNSESQTAALKFMETLENIYRRLCKKEDQIVSLLERCIEEETALRDALRMTEEIPAATKPPSRKDIEREALKRLEEALMGESSDDDSNFSP